MKFQSSGSRQRQGIETLTSDHYHIVANPAKGEKPGEREAEPQKTGYRPGRKSQQRRQEMRKKKPGL